jgi:hypothetical protein
MAMRPIASAYQIATNSGESFVQGIAKTVAPRAPASSPPTAPITAGDVGAPRRKTSAIGGKAGMPRACHYVR